MNVEFPGLGLSFEIRPWAFNVFGLPIYWYGIIIALAFLTAVVLAVRSCKKHDIEQDTILDLALYAVPSAIVGARLYFVVLNWDQFRGNLKAIFEIRSGGLAIYGAIITAVIAAWLYCRIKKIKFLHLADFAVPYLVLGQAIGRWGNFINQEAFGYETTLPWRMNGDVVNANILERVGNIDLTKWGAHPTFLYESLWDLGVFFFLLFHRKKKKADGEVLSFYFILYGIGRFFIENLRTDSLMLGEVRASRLLSLVLVIVFTAVLIYLRTKKKKYAEEETVGVTQSEYSSLLIEMREAEEKELSASVEAEAQDEESSTSAEAAAQDEELNASAEVTAQDESEELREDT